MIEDIMTEPERCLLAENIKENHYFFEA